MQYRSRISVPAYSTQKDFNSLETEVFILNLHYATITMKFRLHLIFSVNRINNSVLWETQALIKTGKMGPTWVYLNGLPGFLSANLLVTKNKA